MTEILVPRASPPTSVPWVPLWPLGGSVGGAELAYAQITGNVTSPVVAASAAVPVVTAPAITCDGATSIIVELGAQVQTGASNGSYLVLSLWMDGVDIGRLATIDNLAAANQLIPVSARVRLTPSVGSHTFVVRTWSTVSAGQVLAGASGAVDAYPPAFIRVSLATATAAPVANPTYGTTLPASPADGQEHILVDSVTNPTYQWRFRYNASSTSAYKWEFIGGADYIARVDANESTTTVGSYVDLTTPGPRMLVPRAGDYDVLGAADAYHTTVASVVFGIFRDSTVFSQTAILIAAGNNWSVLGPVTARVTGCAAGADVRLRYYNGNAGTAAWNNRWIRVRPVRVS